MDETNDGSRTQRKGYDLRCVQDRKDLGLIARDVLEVL